MSKELEIEFKNSLTKEEYTSLLSAYHLMKSDLKTQTNYYFDTPCGLLRKKKMGLRVRVLSDAKEFTLKVPTTDTHSYLEITDSLKSFTENETLYQQINAKQSEVLTYLSTHQVPINQLELIGELTTVRAQKKINPDTLLVLDKSHYYGITDYEIEMEVSNSDSGKRFFYDFLKAHHIATKPTQKKITRMFEQKKHYFV